MTSTGIQRLVSAIVNSRPEGWALLNIECLLFEQELVRTWETMLGLPWRGTLTGLRIGAQAWELRLRELKLALRVLDQGLDVHAGQPTAVEQTARILRSGDVLSFLHALQTAVKDVLGGSKPTPLKAADLASQHERRRSSFVKAWPLGVLIRIRAALLLADFGPEVERSSIEATIAGGLEACSAYISTDLNFRIGSEELEASVCVLQAFAWSLLAFPFYSQYTQLTDRLGSLAMGRVDDRTVMPLLSLETASVSHLMEIMRSILAGTSDEFEGLGKRKRTLDHDFEGPGSQTDGERLSWDVSAGQLVTMWFASTGDGTLGSPALRNLRFYAIAICRQLGTCFRSHDHSVSEALVDDLINVLQPVSGYDGANALDAIDSMIVMANMVSDVHARRLLETMASILSDNFSVLEDPWSLVVILRGASLLLRTVGSDSPVLDDVSKFLSEIIRVMKARLPKGAKKHLHYRGRLELGVFLSNACLAYRDPSSLIESWDSTTIINLVTDDYFQVRISTIRNVPSLFSALQQDVMFLVRCKCRLCAE